MLMLLPPHSSGAILPTPSPPSTPPPPSTKRAPATCHLPPCLPHVMICCSHPVLEGASRLGPRSHDAPFLQGFSFAPTRGPGLLRSVIRGFAQDGPRSSRRSSCGSSPRPVTRIVAARQQQQQKKSWKKKDREKGRRWDTHARIMQRQWHWQPPRALFFRPSRPLFCLSLRAV